MFFIDRLDVVVIMVYINEEKVGKANSDSNRRSRLSDQESDLQENLT